MNETANMFLLTGDKYLPEMHLTQSRFVDHLLKTRKEYKNSRKQKINDIFIKKN